MHKRLARSSTTKKDTVSHQLRPGDAWFSGEVLYEVFFSDRFENAGVAELVAGEDPKERYDVRMRQIATDEGMAVESLYRGGQRNAR